MTPPEPSAAQEEAWEQIRRARPRHMAFYVFACCPLLDVGLALVEWFFRGGGTREFGYLCLVMLTPLAVIGVFLWHILAPPRRRRG